MNIESSSINVTKEAKVSKTSQAKNDASTSFADELKEGAKTSILDEKIPEESVLETKAEEIDNKNKAEICKPLPNNSDLKNALNGLNSVVKEFNQSDDKLSGLIKDESNSADNNTMINKDFNIQENKDLMPQMNPNMNFSGNGQPFSSFMNNDSEQNNEHNRVLNSTAQDLAEEAAILSTMAENIAIANRTQALKDTKTVTNEEGVKKVDAQSGIKIENVVKYDSIIMNQADVEVFVNLVENKELNLNNLAPKAAEKSVQVSKSLADLLVKSMENNQPVRIDFDNNISVIIRISRDGKLSADFLPSSQVAEAYLKENLPLLRQKFDDNNIEYDSLNQRERRHSDKENNKKKDRNNE